MQDSDSDLFQPTLREGAPGPRDKRPEPWRVTSQVWVAFFGGSLALLAIAALNSKRLKLSAGQLRYVLLAGAAGFLLTLVAAFVLGQADVAERWQPGPGGTAFRIVSRAIALLAYLIISRLQRSAERVHLFAGGGHASLWVPGFVAMMALGTVQNLITWSLAE